MIDVSNLADRPADGTFDLEAYERSIQDKNVPNHGKVFKKKHDSDDEDMAEEKKDTGNDWSDADSDGDDSDDMDSDSDNENDNHKKKRKQECGLSRMPRLRRRMRGFVCKKRKKQECG